MNEAGKNFENDPQIHCYASKTVDRETEDCKLLKHSNFQLKKSLITSITKLYIRTNEKKFGNIKLPIHNIWINNWFDLSQKKRILSKIIL